MWCIRYGIKSNGAETDIESPTLETWVKLFAGTGILDEGA